MLFLGGAGSARGGFPGALDLPSQKRDLIIRVKNGHDLGNMKKEKLERAAFQRTHIGFLALGIAALGLAVFLFSSDSPTQESSPDINTEARSGNGYLESELAACGNESTDHGKQACVAFIKQQCPTLKANYASQEKTTIASQDPGFRLSVLQQHHDPFYPVKCFREWLLMESEFAYPDRFPVHSHEPHDAVEMSGDYPRAFSQFPDFSEYSPEYFAHKDAQGKLQFPEKYEIEKKYSRHDQELLNRALHAAYKYADINAAIRDGYVTVPGYILSMGIHFMNPSLFDETVNMDEPEFLTYLKSRSNNTYVLAQIGYIQVKNDNYKKFRYPLFETSEAHGHNHLLNASFINKNRWWRYGMYTKDEPTEQPHPVRSCAHAVRDFRTTLENCQKISRKIPSGRDWMRP